jgi:hypothetical protein
MQLGQEENTSLGEEGHPRPKAQDDPLDGKLCGHQQNSSPSIPGTLSFLSSLLGRGHRALHTYIVLFPSSQLVEQCESS